jgi:nucleoside-diphosphate-sugar epimerase
MKISNPAIPLGSTVVVIGANGYIALETCVKLLEAGFRVRGTVRDVQQHRGWMHKLFDTTWPSMFELVQVPDFEADKAFDVAFKGPYPSPIHLECATTYTGSPITGSAVVIYVSTLVLFDTDPAKVIGPTVNGTINTPEAAARAGVKRYVLAGSLKAVATNFKKMSRHVDAEEKKIW